MRRAIHVHRGIAARRAGLVVGAEDGAVEGDIALIGARGSLFTHIDQGVAQDEGALAAAKDLGCIVSIVFADGAAVQVDVGVAHDLAGDLVIIGVGIRTLSAAIHALFDRAAVDVDRGVVFVAVVVVCHAHLSVFAAAIDGAADGAAADIDRGVGAQAEFFVLARGAGLSS